MDAFVEERLDVGIDYGAVGGPGFSTDVVVFGSGYEHRNANWDNARGKWELGDRTLLKADMEALQAFFRARRGKSVAFRYRDWNDWQAQGEPLSPDGGPTVQLVKTYANAGQSEVRRIKKPVSGTVSMTKNGSDYTPASIDTTTGTVTLATEASASISDVTAAAPAVVTATGNGYSIGDVIYITGTGLSEIDDQAWTITVLDADTFELDGSDTSGTNGSSSGTADKFVQPDDTLTWSGEFDVPARFDTDEFRARFDAYDPDSGDAAYYLATLPLVEVRL